MLLKWCVVLRKNVATYVLSYNVLLHLGSADSITCCFKKWSYFNSGNFD